MHPLDCTLEEKQTTALLPDYKSNNAHHKITVIKVIYSNLCLLIITIEQVTAMVNGNRQLRIEFPGQSNASISKELSTRS